MVSNTVTNFFFDNTSHICYNKNTEKIPTVYCRDKEIKHAELSERIALRFFDNLIKQKEENNDEKSRQNLQTHHSPHAPPCLAFIISRRYYLRAHYSLLNVKQLKIFLSKLQA